ncbi:MAG TPA: hypothetical protein VF273_11350 [Pelobium sp.]
MKKRKITSLKKFATLLLFLMPCILFAQRNTVATDGFTVTGQIKKNLTINIDDIKAVKSEHINNVVIKNHSGEAKKILKNITGVLVKELLKEMELKANNPKEFSEFYLTFVAADDYKVVYSWNEIFNSPTGNNLFLVTSENGKSLGQMEDRLLIITPTDFKTGRRHIKGLQKIVVSRVD